MKHQYAIVGWRFWFQWVLANAVAGAVTLAVTGAMIRAGSLNAAVVVAVVGAALGIMQWLVLRRQASRAYLYLPANIVAFALALSVGEAVGFAVGGAARWLGGGVLFGVVAGSLNG